MLIRARPAALQACTFGCEHFVVCSRNLSVFLLYHLSCALIRACLRSTDADGNKRLPTHPAAPPFPHLLASPAGPACSLHRASELVLPALYNFAFVVDVHLFVVHVYLARTRKEDWPPKRYAVVSKKSTDEFAALLARPDIERRLTRASRAWQTICTYI